MIVKVCVLHFKEGLRDTWLKCQPVWNKGQHDAKGFRHAEILLRVDDPDEAVVYELWDTYEDEKHFIANGGKICYEKTQVGDLLVGEEGEFYTFDHASKDNLADDPIWTPESVYEDGSDVQPFTKLLTLKMKPGRTEDWLAKQHLWNRAMHDTGGFIGGDILRRIENENETLLCARWTSKEALDHFMATGSPILMEKTAVGDLFEAEVGRNYHFDHHSYDNQATAV